MKPFLEGHFHAHITVRNDTEDPYFPPKGWKTTIIILNKADRSQRDAMITRHFMLGSEKTPDMLSIMAELDKASQSMTANGYEVLRSKLEHESLPTLPPSAETYREAHIKIRKPLSTKLLPLGEFVQSRNAMETSDTHEVVFLNARWYAGTVDAVDAYVDVAVKLFQEMNPDAEVLDVKKETTVFDTNLNLDKWWA